MDKSSLLINEGKNRRRFHRVKYNAEAVVTDEHGNRVEGKIENLSLKGAYINTPNVTDVGEVVNIEINISSSSSELKLKLKGKVVRSDRNGLGVEFGEIDIDSFIHLKTAVALNYGDLDKIEEEFHEFVRQRIQAPDGR